MNDLELQFQEDLLNTYRESKKIGYKPSIFLEMIGTYGGVGTAKRLLSTEDYIQEGIKRLWELGRLDLSVEAKVLNDEYRDLFTNEERKIANKRLKELGYFN